MAETCGSIGPGVAEGYRRRFGCGNISGTPNHQSGKHGSGTMRTNRFGRWVAVLTITGAFALGGFLGGGFQRTAEFDWYAPVVNSIAR